MIYISVLFWIALFLLGAAEFASFITYGTLLSDKYTKYLLEKHLKNYHFNSFDPHILHNSGKPYLAHGSGSLLAKWHISSIGRIPRWSHWSRAIDQRVLEMLAEEPTNGN